jgi:hypothetical protein
MPRLLSKSFSFCLSSDNAVNCTVKMVHAMHTRHSIQQASKVVQMQDGMCWLLPPGYCLVSILAAARLF